MICNLREVDGSLWSLLMSVLEFISSYNSVSLISPALFSPPADSCWQWKKGWKNSVSATCQHQMMDKVINKLVKWLKVLFFLEKLIFECHSLSWFSQLLKNRCIGMAAAMNLQCAIWEVGNETQKSFFTNSTFKVTIGNTFVSYQNMFCYKIDMGLHKFYQQLVFEICTNKA